MSSLVKYIPAKGVLDKVLSEITEPEVRMVRRGKFFLSDYTMTSNASMRRPIYQYWGHRVLVADQVYESRTNGYWCYASHNDFETIPDTTDPLEWPEYERTDTGWVCKAIMLSAVKPSIDLLKFDWSKILGAAK